jgi:hypothetical protein
MGYNYRAFSKIEKKLAVIRMEHLPYENLKEELFAKNKWKCYGYYSYDCVLFDLSKSSFPDESL